MSLNVQRRFYSLKEFAEIFGLDRVTVRRYIADGQVKAFRVGPETIRIPVTEIERLTSNPIGTPKA